MKTGIIYCPKHDGLKSAKKRWKRIADALAAHGVEYDLIHSESADSVERHVNMMIHNGYDTIILAGGDSALNDAANCLMKLERKERENITIGVIPNGRMNDFASFWGFDGNALDSIAENIKAHRTRKVDVGVLTCQDSRGEQHTRYFFNCVNVGLIAGIQHLRNTTRHMFWSRKASFLISFFFLIFLRMEYKLRYTIDFEEEELKIMNMCIGSCHGYGMTPNAVPYNGMLDVTVIKHSPLKQLFNGIQLFLRGKLLNYKGIKPYRSRNVLISIPQNTPLNIDGREYEIAFKNEINLSISVMSEEITFLIEK